MSTASSETNFFHYTVPDTIPLKELKALCKEAGHVLRSEPNVLYIPTTKRVLVLGPVRGYFDDTLSYLERTSPSWDVVLFLGDVADGGGAGVKMWYYLMKWKVARPQDVFILRGRRETTRTLPWYMVSGASTLLREELLHHFGGPRDASDAYRTLAASVFVALPLVAVVHEAYMCVCGGLSPALHSLSDLDTVNRFEENPQQGIVCDVLWSDPMDEEEQGFYPNALYLHNQEKGMGHMYSFNATVRFLKENNLVCIVRANSYADVRGERGDGVPMGVAGRPYHYQHSPYDPGYALGRKSPLTNFPTFISLFTAAHYLNINANRAAVLLIEASKQLNVVQLSPAKKRAFSLPCGKNGLSWSAPFALDCVRGLLETLRDYTDDALFDEHAASVAESEAVRQKRLDFKKLCCEVAASNPGALEKALSMLPKLAERKHPECKVFDVTAFPRLQSIASTRDQLHTEAAAAWRTLPKATAPGSNDNGDGDELTWCPCPDPTLPGHIVEGLFSLPILIAPDDDNDNATLRASTIPETAARHMPGTATLFQSLARMRYVTSATLHVLFSSSEVPTRSLRRSAVGSTATASLVMYVLVSPLSGASASVTVVTAPGEETSVQLTSDHPNVVLDATAPHRICNNSTGNGAQSSSQGTTIIFLAVEYRASREDDI